MDQDPSIDTLVQMCCATFRNAYHPFPGLPVEEAISLNGKTWTPGATIGVGFLDGSGVQRAKVARLAARWTEFANLDLVFDAPAPDVRVAFGQGGSWSLIGTDCRVVRSGPTLNLGWVTDSSDEVSDRAVIVHEFGHALGLGHEQSSPLNDIHWDKARALAYFMRTQGWTAQMVEDNVFAVFDPSRVTGTAYDRASIMQYPVDASLTTDGRGIGWNTDLSALDRAYVAQLYPGRGTARPTTPPVVPPHPALPMVVVGGPAVARPIPGPGLPAEFGLRLDSFATLRLTVTVTGSFGREPVVEVVAPGGQVLALGLPRGVGTFRFIGGDYVLRVHHPLPRMTGVARVRAMPG